MALLLFALVVFSIRIATAIVTLRNTFAALTVVGVERMDETKIEHAMSTARPGAVFLLLLLSMGFIVAELFDDAKAEFNFHQPLLISNSVERESCQLR